MKKSIPILLVIAGSDSIGGAGLQADIKTACAFDVYTQCVVTAITAQNSCGVVLSEPVSSEMLKLQLETVLSDFLPDAVKIGMIPNSESVRIIVDVLNEFGVKNIVVDPVLAPTSGNSLNDDKIKLAEALKKHLFPISCLITPNYPETLFLAGLQDDCHSELLFDDHDTELFERLNCDALVLKGGHVDADNRYSVDRLLRKGHDTKIFKSQRLFGKEFHGTGCGFATAIACMLAKGYSLEKAVEQAHFFIHAAMTGVNAINCEGASMLDFTIRNFKNIQ